MNVLIIEDIGFSSRIVETFLKGLGYGSMLATNGYEALSILESDKAVDVVICDYFLPDIDGFQVFQQTQQLKRYKRTGPPPFVLLTSNVNPKFLREAEKMGFTAVLNKPFQPEQLKDILLAVDEGQVFLQKDNDKTKILVADSHGRNHELLQEVFKGTGYTLLLVASVTECLDCLNQYKSIKTVVTELDLSDQDAFALKAEALKQGLQTPFILLTDTEDVDRIQMALMSGFQEVIQYPIDKFALKQKLNRAFFAFEQTSAPHAPSILIVDDIGFHSTMTKNILLRSEVIRSKGFTLQTASKGFDALEMIKTDPSIQLVICDLMLPDIDGLELMDQLNHLFANNPAAKPPTFVMLTVSANTQDFEQARALGFAEIFRKPVEADPFLKRIEAFIKD
jgi:CheY-like chemotaxis protein